MDPLLRLILAQGMLGLNNGVFYAMLSLGLAVIFGLLNVVNFAHGALYMLGAFLALILYSYLGIWIGISSFSIGFWPSLILVPVLVACFGMLIERFMLRRLYKLDPIYSLLLTFGVTLVLQGLFINFFNASGTPYPGMPESLRGVVNLGFMMFPKYRLFVILFSIVVCFVVWYVIERTRIGSRLRAGTENPELVKAFGINVPLMVMLTFGFGTGLAGLAGVLAAPIYSVSPLMGANLIIVIFAVVVIGGMGSIAGAVVTGFALGLVEGMTKVFYAPAANTVIFLLMVIVLLVRPNGLFGRSS
ncbi:branched-chain amino acid ABC transporter permease [Pseudooceanicola algae]|uniref:High-affinity branched-chain amino acid transport system permease protein LivH n=1 Tax=Pseudooceanicola algae TaxID=1537215 RepID=A0A418SLH2_9RHOB|nr:branched-chain amino acid ABC transporter permease [Pseudooceanicola algae]QPM90588.1 High-affinity branched-chain amino acid transport system permease protein LivH [Pseudooceanicola algae]